MTWFLVFAGEVNWTRAIAGVLEQGEVVSIDAHSSLFASKAASSWVFCSSTTAVRGVGRSERNSNPTGIMAFSTVLKPA